MWNRIHRPGNAWIWDLWNTAWADYMELRANQQGGEVIYTAESTEPENSWQRMTSISLHAPQCAMHSMLAFCSKAQHQKGLKMMLNISLALLKSTDHAEPLKLHSLFYPSSQNINVNLIITNTIKSCTEYQQILGIVLTEKFSSRVKKFTKTSGSVKQKSRLQQLLL